MQTSKLQDMFFITIFQYAERNRKHTKHLFTNISYGKLASSCFTCITFPCTLHPYDNHIYSCIKLAQCLHESIKFI